MSGDIYEEIGVTTVINARGSITTLGGSLVPPDVIDAMDAAAGSFVRMDELVEWAGRAIAEATGAQAGLVASGAAGGIVLAGAACLTGRDRTAMERLPETTGADEFVIQHRHSISHARGIRTAGGRFVEAGDEAGTTPAEIEAAMGEETAALFHVVLDPGPAVPLEEAAAIAHDHGLPVIVDAAAELPPPENLGSFLEAGADLVIFSGGKNIRGPNDAGLLAGRADLVEAARLQAFPNDGIGRPMKVSKEQIVGQVRALERWVARDHEAQQARWRAMAERACEGLADLDGVTATVAFPESGPRPLSIPRARVAVDDGGIPAAEVAERLRGGTPPIETAVVDSHLWINPEHLQAGEVDAIVDRLRSIVGGRG